jgi:hypothetical protein
MDMTYHMDLPRSVVAQGKNHLGHCHNYCTRNSLNSSGYAIVIMIMIHDVFTSCRNGEPGFGTSDSNPFQSVCATHFFKG